MLIKIISVHSEVTGHAVPYKLLRSHQLEDHPIDY